MEIILYWFKRYKIIESQDYHHITYFKLLIDHCATEHSAGNVIALQKLFENVTGKEIPTIDIYTNFYYRIDAENYMGSLLIEPEKMMEMCNKVLAHLKGKDNDLEDKVLYIRKLSDLGYYIAYDAAG